MEGLGQLIIFSIVMLVGSYGAGSAPLFMPMSEEKLHLVSVMGAGLLVGEKIQAVFWTKKNFFLGYFVLGPQWTAEMN